MSKKIIKDLDIWIMSLGPANTNLYIIKKQNNNKAVLIDPANDFEKIKNFLIKEDIEPVAILLTHGHSDHIYAVNQIKDYYKIDVFGSKYEVDIANNYINNVSDLFGVKVEVDITKEIIDSQILNLADLNITVLETPGHTKGSVTYYLKEYGIMFTGDTLFKNSIGRWDFPTGNYEILKDSIKKLSSFSDETIIYPGHGIYSTIGIEKRDNPFINEDLW